MRASYGRSYAFVASCALTADRPSHFGEQKAKSTRYQVWQAMKTMAADFAKIAVIVHGLSDNPRLGVSRGKFTISGDEVEKIFEPVVHEVKKLVMDQIRDVRLVSNYPKAVVLVGGFGQNAYLRDCLRELLRRFCIKVLQPPKG